MRIKRSKKMNGTSDAPDIKAYSLLFAGIFALSFTVTVIFMRTVGPQISSDIIAEHFSPVRYGISFFGALFDSFCEDALNLAYAFVFGFTFFGKPANAALSALRGIAFGHSFGCMTELLSLGTDLFTQAEYVLYPLFSLTVNSLIIVFCAESSIFNSNFRKYRKGIPMLLREPFFHRYLYDFLGILGLSVILKAIYTLIIFAIE